MRKCLLLFVFLFLLNFNIFSYASAPEGYVYVSQFSIETSLMISSDSGDYTDKFYVGQTIWVDGIGYKTVVSVVYQPYGSMEIDKTLVALQGACPGGTFDVYVYGLVTGVPTPTVTPTLVPTVTPTNLPSITPVFSPTSVPTITNFNFMQLPFQVQLIFITFILFVFFILKGVISL